MNHPNKHHSSIRSFPGSIKNEFLLKREEDREKLRTYLRHTVFNGFCQGTTNEVTLPSLSGLALGLRCDHEEVIQELESLRLLGYEYTIKSSRSPIRVYDSLNKQVG